ncbi:MAG: hypothetical protein A4S17_11410 [Proteobacteria bacterium HN_bin10]|nr:MAG: hypothetical protein A4S17_11410 [Proteobacteria bacterium HN_bin10]
MTTIEDTTAIDRNLLAALAGRPSSFRALLQLLNGEYPSDVLTALRRAAPDPLIETLLVDAGLSARTVSNQIAELPLPHPCDFEWRFTSGTAVAMLARLEDATQPADTTLLVGMPSLVVAANRSALDRHWNVIGTDDIIWSVLSKLTRDDARFAVVSAETRPVTAAIVDPPWYPSAYDEMFDAFVRRCAIGAIVLVGAPPSGARPNAEADVAAMIAAAKGFGLEFQSLEPGVLRYRSPAFELAALAQAGIRTHLPDWRRGDLITFRKTRDVAPAPATIERPAAFEVTLDGVRFRALFTNPNDDGPLTPLTESEIFPTVSTRAEGRSRANFWTSGNRAFQAPLPQAVAALAALALDHGVASDPMNSLEKLVALGNRSATQALMWQFHDVAVRETAAMEELVGAQSWLRSVKDARFLNSSSSTFLRDRLGGGA